MSLNLCFIAIDESLQIPVFIGVMKKLNAAYNDVNATLIIASQDKELLKEMNYTDRVIFFDKGLFTHDMSCSETNILNNSAIIKKQLSHASAEESFDIVINLGFSQISSLVCSIIKAASYQGAVYDEYSRTRIDDPWLNYLNSVKDDGTCNTFNYVDLVLSGLSSIEMAISSSTATKNDILKHKDTSIYNEDDSLKAKRNIFIHTGSDLMNGIAQELTARIQETYKNYIVSSGDQRKYTEADLVITDDVLFSMSSSVLGNKVVFISSDEDQVLYSPYGEGNYVMCPKSKSGKIYEDIVSLLGFIFNHRDRALLITPNSNLMVSRFDLDGFMEYVPLLRKRITNLELYSWIYRAVFKCTMSRVVRAGDSQRFLAFGEKYIDRVVDIDRQAEYLCENIINKYNSDDILSASSKFGDAIDQITVVKDIAFEGQKKAKEFLNVVAVDSGNMDEIKRKRNELAEVDLRIYDLINHDRCFAEPFIRSFIRERDDAYVANLFPLAKRIMCLYEDLFSKISFLEEIIKELWKRIN